MKKLIGIILFITLLNSCTLSHRPDQKFSAKPLVKDGYSRLLTNKTNNNKDFFNHF